MNVRTYLTAGVAAVAASAVVAAPTTVVEPRTPVALVASPRVDLTAAVKPLVLRPLERQQAAEALAVIARLDPEAAAAPVAPQNVASDWITAGYEFIKGWVQYGVELTQYVLQFIPFGYLIGDQVGIIYYNLVQPIADSVVYDLINPVVNNPLNLNTWVNGFVDVGVTSVNALIDTGIAEFYNFFGWLIPPLPGVAQTASLTTMAEELPTDVVEQEPENLVELTTRVQAKLEDRLDGAFEAVRTAVGELLDGPRAAEPVKVQPDAPDAVDAPVTPDVPVTLDAPVDPEPAPAVTKPFTGPLTKSIPKPLSRFLSRTTSPTGVSAQGEVRPGGQPTVDEAESSDSPKSESSPRPRLARTLRNLVKSLAPKAPDTKAPETKPEAPKDDKESGDGGAS